MRWMSVKDTVAAFDHAALKTAASAPLWLSHFPAWPLEAGSWRAMRSRSVTIFLKP